MPARPYTLFMLLKASARWLALEAEERHALADDAMAEIYNRFPSVRLRFFNAGAFHGRCSDVLVWHTTDLPEYRAAADTLRANPFLSEQHFDVLDVIPSVPDDWREYEWDGGQAWA
ncbi:MAG TPA: darcynin family protein [Ideonella sp.]|uniref:darcynin family protein n=1 Tax=Ideonella sp. TaxID=1929293 RepID=UPI002BCFCE47|nr:darcynin family protein [Ideonella sp.]HSI48866.1 darcynin family protein [Ideonella sp.]